MKRIGLGILAVAAAFIVGEARAEEWIRLVCKLDDGSVYKYEFGDEKIIENGSLMENASNYVISSITISLKQTINSHFVENKSISRINGLIKIELYTNKMEYYNGSCEKICPLQPNSVFLTAKTWGVASPHV